MGLLQDLRKRQTQQTYAQHNTDTLRRELGRDLPKDDLSDTIQMMGEPEVHEALFANAEAFSKQPELDDVLRAQLRMKTLDILGSDSKRLNTVLSAFNDASETDEPIRDSSRLADKLVLSDRDAPVSVADRITQRIKETRQDINDRVDYQKQKVKQVSRSVERRLKPLTAVAQDSVKGLVQGVKDRVQSFKDDYRTRQITIENAQNWEDALDDGITEDQIRSVIEHSDYPEVRYGVMKHASKLFQQDAMTPELATDLFYAYQPHTNAQNPDHDRFYKEVENYANNVVDDKQTQAPAFDSTIFKHPSISDKTAGTTTLMRYTLSKAGHDPHVPTPLREALDEQLSFAGYNKDGENVWTHHTEDNTDVLINDDDAEGIAMAVYTHAATKNMLDNAKSVDTVNEPSPDHTNDKYAYLREYGDSNAVPLEHSHTLSRLMRRNGIDTLPDLQRTSDEMDVKQAQLLGISSDGDAVWGVPDKGEITYLSDEELERAFMEQYGKTIEQNDIPVPDTTVEPVRDDNFFDQLADSFNREWNDETALMQEGAPAPEEYDAPPLPEEDDVPPLMLDDLDEAIRVQGM